MLNEDWKKILDGLKNEKEFSDDYHDVVKYLENPVFCTRGHEAMKVIVVQHPEITVEEFRKKVCEERQDFITFLCSLTSTEKMEELQVKEKEKLYYLLGNRTPKCNTECILITLEIDTSIIKRILAINRNGQNRRLIDFLHQRFPRLELKTIFKILKEHQLNETALKLCEVAIRVTQPLKSKTYS